MGVKYSASDSAALIQAMTNNVQLANDITDRLSSGCDHLISCLDSGELQGAAYTAGRGLFSDIIIPCIQKIQAAVDDIEQELQAYKAADSSVSEYGSLDKDQLEELKRLKERQLENVEEQIEENESFTRQLSALLSGTSFTLWRQTSVLYEVKYHLEVGISDLTERLNKLDWFVTQVSQYFTDSLTILNLAIQGASQLSQVIVDSGGNYYTDGLDMSWVSKMKDEEIETHSSDAYQSPTEQLIDDSVSDMRLSQAGETFYRSQVSALLEGNPSSKSEPIIKAYNDSLMIDDAGNIILVTKLSHGKGFVYLVYKNGKVDNAYTTQLNQEINNQFWQSLGDNALQVIIGAVYVLGGLSLGTVSAGLGGLGGGIAPVTGGLSLSAEPAAVAGLATSGTIVAGGTVLITDALSKIATANSSMDISFAKSHEDRVKEVGKTRKNQKVSNMSEFFKTDFGRKIKNILQKTNKRYDGQRIYKVTENIGDTLKKGDQVYLDGLHKDHLEVFTKNGRLRNVLNLDGTPNIDKFYKAGMRRLK